MSDSAGEHPAARAFRVTGRVQGVGFRWWTCRVAEDLQVSGTVRNRRDGSVEVKAIGSPRALDDLYHHLGRGPASACVESVEELEPDPDTPRSGFRIDR